MNERFCSECGNPISPETNICDECGCPYVENITQHPINNQIRREATVDEPDSEQNSFTIRLNRNTIIAITIVVVIIIGGIGAYFLFTTHNQEDKTKSADYVNQKAVQEEAVQENVYSHSEPAKADMLNMKLAGTISGDIHVKLNLDLSDRDAISGTACYVIKGVDGNTMAIRGNEYDGMIYLTEIYCGDITGYYEGTLENDIFSGYWFKPDRSKSRHFELRVQ